MALTSGHKAWPVRDPCSHRVSSTRDAKELRENLYAARKKPVRTAIDGQVWILRVGVYDSFGQDAFRVHIEPAGSELRLDGRRTIE